MKNNKNYCKFVSQVKSSQVKSSAKIVSLIALFILLFSISCKAKQNPKYSELEGTWKSYTSDIALPVITFTVDSAGNLNFNCLYEDKGFYHYNYTGKLTDDFEYPYTIELTFNISSYTPFASCSLDSLLGEISKFPNKSLIGKFIFSDASTCAASFDTIVHGGDTTGSHGVYPEKLERNFKK